MSSYIRVSGINKLLVIFILYLTIQGRFMEFHELIQ